MTLRSVLVMLACIVASTGCGTSPSSTKAYERGLLAVDASYSVFKGTGTRPASIAMAQGVRGSRFESFSYFTTMDGKTGLRFEVIIPHLNTVIDADLEVIASAYTAMPFPRRCHYLLRYGTDGWELIRKSTAFNVLREHVENPGLLRFIDRNWGEHMGEYYDERMSRRPPLFPAQRDDDGETQSDTQSFDLGEREAFSSR